MGEVMRKSNFELLRIILILMVIGLHYFNGNMGGALDNVLPNSFNYYFVHFMESLCIVAVNVFIMITGYFSYNKKSVKISKVIYLLYLCLFYGLLIFIGMIIFNGLVVEKESIKMLLKAILNRWFVLAYIALYLLIPFINVLIKNISKENLKRLIMINIIFFYLFSTIYSDTLIRDNGYGITNFVNLYLIGAYIGKYNVGNIQKYKSCLLYLICAIVTTLISCFTDRNAYAYSSIFNLIGAIALFLTFKNLNIKSNKFINNISSYTFSAYIIHENAYLCLILYRLLFKCDLYYTNNFLIVNFIYTILGIYAICLIVEKIRRLLFKRIIDNRIDKISYEIILKEENFIK